MTSARDAANSLANELVDFAALIQSNPNTQDPQQRLRAQQQQARRVIVALRHWLDTNAYLEQDWGEQ